MDVFQSHHLASVCCGTDRPHRTLLTLTFPHAHSFTYTYRFDSTIQMSTPGHKRLQLREEATTALASLVPDTNSRVLYKAHDSTGRMQVLLSGGAPSDSYEKSLGAARHGKDGAPEPPSRMLNRDEIRDVVMADRVTSALGGTDLGERLQGTKPFEPKLLSCVFARACNPSAFLIT